MNKSEKRGKKQRDRQGNKQKNQTNKNLNIPENNRL